MIKIKNLRVILAICLFFAAARSDVPPEPGFVRQSVPLILETQDDLSEYRFFISSIISLNEVQISKGQKTNIGAEDRIGAGRVGTLLAIPKKSLGELRLSNPDELKKLIDEKRADGIVRILTHDFQTTIREIEKSSWTGRVYRLERSTEKGIVATLLSGGLDVRSQESGVSFGVYDVSSGITCVGPVLLALVIAALGIWLFSRSSKIK